MRLVSQILAKCDLDLDKLLLVKKMHCAKRFHANGPTLLLSSAMAVWKVRVVQTTPKRS